MRIGVYFCNCGKDGAGIISSKIDARRVQDLLSGRPGVAYVGRLDFACAEDGQAKLEADLRAEQPDRVVIAACSPRDHEETFRRVLQRAGMNPYLMQMVNVREQIVWVTADGDRATEKAIAMLSAGIARVPHHTSLEKGKLAVCADVAVIGAGPAGLKAAITLAGAGRQVTLVEQGPILGGAPVRREDVFPRMECGPCLLEPIMGQVLHGDLSSRIRLLLLSEVVDVKGTYGNFDLTIRKRPRYVTATCVGCAGCIEDCPVSVPNPVNLNRSTRKAIDFEFFGGLPNIPFIDPHTCRRLAASEECTQCVDACPVEGAIRFDEREELLSCHAGAIIVAVGADTYDLARLPALGYGRFPDVYSSIEFERLLAANGPTGGTLIRRDGSPARHVAIVNCAGSLDAEHVPYCSGYCCLDALKFDHVITHKAPGTRVVNYYRTIVAPGKEEYAAFTRVRAHPDVEFLSYVNPADLSVEAGSAGRLDIVRRDGAGALERRTFDMIVLMAPIVPSPAARALGEMLDLSYDGNGFFGELHGCTDAARSKVRGIYLAGTCQAPMDIQHAMTQGMAATGYVLSELVEGRVLELDPVTAIVDEDRCAGCRTCVPICPYKAIAFDGTAGVAQVTSALCLGCGTCVAACPAGAITGSHFTTKAILAEVEAVLA